MAKDASKMNISPELHAANRRAAQTRRRSRRSSERQNLLPAGITAGSAQSGSATPHHRRHDDNRAARRELLQDVVGQTIDLFDSLREQTRFGVGIGLVEQYAYLRYLITGNVASIRKAPTDDGLRYLRAVAALACKTISKAGEVARAPKMAWYKATVEQDLLYDTDTTSWKLHPRFFPLVDLSNSETVPAGADPLFFLRSQLAKRSMAGLNDLAREVALAAIGAYAAIDVPPSQNRIIAAIEVTRTQYTRTGRRSAVDLGLTKAHAALQAAVKEIRPEQLAQSNNSETANPA